MKNVLFIHRSVGHNLLEDGNVYNLVAQASPTFSFSDYDHNLGVLSDSSGAKHKLNYVFPGNDTRPADYAALFSKQNTDEYKVILEKFLNYDVIIIKSCYPNSNLRDNRELEAAKASYLSIGEFFVMLPEKKLIILTSPPLVPLRTSAAAAGRACQLADWLANTDLGNNVSVFNFFDLLAEKENKRGANRLRHEYRRWLPVDSHPNKQASQKIAPIFVDFIASKL